VDGVVDSLGHRRVMMRNVAQDVISIGNRKDRVQSVRERETVRNYWETAEHGGAMATGLAPDNRQYPTTPPRRVRACPIFPQHT